MSETRALGHHGAGQDNTGAHPAGNGASGAGANARAGHGGSARPPRRALARPRPGGPGAGRLAATLCAGVLLASAGTARAQSETPPGPTPSDPTARHACTADVLSARLTAGTGSGVAGFDATAGHGSLSKTGFSIPGKRYTVRALELVREGEDAGTLRLGFTTELESDHGLILHVGEARFALADSTRLSGGRTVEWSGSGLGLAPGGAVDVRFAQRIRRVGGSKDIGTPVLRQTSRLPYAEGDTVRLSYRNKPLKRECLPPPGAFRVTENGAEVGVREVSLQYATVALALERALAAGTEVRADYVPPADNALQTSFGTMSDAFAGVVVHNNTVAPEVEAQEPEPLVALFAIETPDVEYWSANLTVRDLGSGSRGCGNPGASNINDCRNTATLTDSAFRHLDRRYRVSSLWHATGRLRFSTTTTNTTLVSRDEFRTELTLRIGNNIALAFSDARVDFVDADPGDPRDISWPTTTAINNAMTVGRTVRVRITGPDHAPEMPAHRQVAQVDENSGGGVVVRRVEDTGVSGGTPPYQFSLEGADASRYDIDANTGNIITRAGVTYDHESTPECYNSAGFVGRCHKLTLRATSAGSGTTRLSATRPLWVRVMDKFEWEGHAAQEPGVVRLEWDSPGGDYFRELCPVAGYDVLYSPLDGTSGQRSFDAGTTSATLRGLYPGQEYVVRMRERHPERTPGSGCPFSGPLQWVRGTVRTNGHPGTGTAMPRISLVIPDLLNPDDINLPGSASLDVGEGTTQTMRVLVDLSQAEYFPRHDDGFALSLEYTWANRAPPGSTSRSEPAVLRQVAQRHGKRWVMDYRVDIPDGSAGNGPLDIEMSVRHMTRNGERVRDSGFGRGFAAGGTRVSFGVCKGGPRLRSAEVPANAGNLILTFDEALDTTTARRPAANRFTVKVDNRDHNPNSVRVSGRTVRLFGFSVPILATQVVTVSYGDEGGCGVDDTRAIQNTSGEDALSFTNIGVTNNSTRYSTSLLLREIELHGGSYVRMHFNQNVSTRRPPYSAWRIFVNGEDRLAPGGAVYDHSGSAFGVLYAGDIETGDLVRVEYHDPTPGDDRDALQNVHGLDAASFCVEFTNTRDRVGTRFTRCTLSSGQDAGSEPEPAPGPLTAQWSPPPPATHNGTAFTVGLEFSEAVSASAEEVTAAVSATGATVTGAALADGSDRLWNLTVTPSGTEGVSLFLAATNDCADAGAICTAGGKALSGGLAHAMLFAPWLSVDDAEATEGADATMDFTVTLAPAAGGTVTVDYATSDGTATEPADYTSTTGTLTFTAGQTTKTVSVPIVDDDTPDSGETFTLTLGDVGGTEIVDVVDATATGTILNHEAPAGPLTGFTLVDASTNADVGTIADGATFTLPAPANGSYGVRVETSGNAEFGSVKLALSGARAATQTESVAPWSLYGDDGTNVAGAGLPTGSYTLTATAHAEAGGQGEALQTLTVSFTVAAAPPLAGFTLVDASTNTDVGTIADGATFTLPAPANGSYGVRVETSGNAEFGSVKLALSGARTATQTESVAPWSLYGDDGTNVAGAGLPAGSYTLTATAHAEAGGQGAALQTLAVSFTVVERLTLSVHDATAAEAAGATVDFTVTLSRASAETVTVDYATSNGTATAESDYTATSGTLTFAADDLSKTVSVPVLDDAVDEESETFTLTLSDAEGGNVHLADATATGTITNDDPMPRAWLARLGRTLGAQAVDMVAARLEGGGATQVTVGGQRLDLSGGAAAPAEEEEDVRGALEALGLGEEAPAGTPRTLSARELLLGSSFDLGAGGEGGAPAWAAWGRVATGGFDAAEDGVRLSGSVTSAFLGADVARERWLAGLALSLSEGEGDYAHAETGSGGEVESRLTALYPYARLSVTERLDVWGLAGIGEGELALTHAHRGATAPGSRVLGPGAHPEAAEAAAQRWGADIAMRMGAVGVRGEVLAPAAPGGLALAVRSDALWVRTSSDAVRASYGNLGAAQADATRLRLALEGSRSFEAGAGALTPRLEVGLRHDGGDAETGSGVELGASVRYEGAGVSAEGAVRTLVAHESQGYEEWGASGALRIAPDASGRGLSLTLAPAVGAAGTATERLWSAADARALAPGGAFEAARRLEAELGYGFAMGSGSYTGTPTLGLGLTGASREVRVGWRLAEARSAGLVFGLDVEGVRREGAGGEAGHGLVAGFGWKLEGAGARGGFEVRIEGERRAPGEGAAEHRVGVTLGARW